MDLHVHVTDENGTKLGYINIYQDGSDVEGTTQIIQWVGENFEIDPGVVINALPLGGELEDYREEPNFPDY